MGTLGIQNDFEGFEPIINVDHLSTIKISFEEDASIGELPDRLRSRVRDIVVVQIFHEFMWA